ncbi:MAG: hypothetical protein U9P80_07035 [Thermodesulfobacteriota bacterium]|nr:hypothetical protein [Thermodesulfobacteriota bacterium]
MMDTIKDVFGFFVDHPFLLGLAIGLVVAAIVWIKGAFGRRSSRKETSKLKENLYTKMEIDAKGHKTREDEFEKIRKENENLRVSVKSLQQKAGRSEIRQLHIYDKAIHTMLARAPGFSATWEIVLNEAQNEMEKSDTGITAFVRKVFVPQQGALEEKNADPHKPQEDEPALIDYEEDKER